MHDSPKPSVAPVRDEVHVVYHDLQQAIADVVARHPSLRIEEATAALAHLCGTMIATLPPARRAVVIDSLTTNAERGVRVMKSLIELGAVRA